MYIYFYIAQLNALSKLNKYLLVFFKELSSKATIIIFNLVYDSYF